MPVLEVTEISKFYGALHVLDAVSFAVESGNKVGLIGANGTGKTTLLNVIEGREEYDSGHVHVQSGARLGYLTQEPRFTPGVTVEQEMLAVFEALQAQAEKLAALELEMGQPGNTSDPPRLEELMARYSALREKFERDGGYSYRSRVRQVLTGLGLPAEFWGRPLEKLSGGEKTRAALSRLLLSEPDLLLLDEPTNYLDMGAIEWLEKFLVDYSGAVLVVSHDRYFLDRVATAILELTDRRIERYKGNYSAYCQQKQDKLDAWKKAYALQQREIARQEKMIRESRATEKAKKEAQSRQKRLDHVDRIERPPEESERMRVKFDMTARSGRRAVDVENLTKSFRPRTILNAVSFGIEYGDKVALIGPNGAGKTTLLRILQAQEQPDSGRIRWGHGVSTGYYAQEDPGFDLKGTPFEEIVAQRGMDNLAARSHLARFLFRGDDVFKRCEDLSGGERRRLALARLVLTRANFLILDEPTNHLDLQAIEALEEALEGYPGTLLFVSHDRYFVNRVANRLLILGPNGTLAVFNGTYEQYQAERAAGQALEAQPRSASTPSPGENGRTPRPRKVSRRVYEELEIVEREIQEGEARRQEIARLLCSKEVYEDYQETGRLTAEDSEAAARLEMLYNRWAELNALIEDAAEQ